MLSEIIEQIGSIPFIVRILIVVIIGGFMPFTSFTFFYSMLDKKEADFKKAMSDMGMKSSKRTVRDTFKWTHFILPFSFIFLICFLSISFILFAPFFAGEINDSILLAGAKFGSDPGDQSVIMRSMVALSYAFMGGFIWSATNIIRRLIKFDLSPYVYYSAGIRIILAATVSIVLAFTLPESINNGLPAISLIAGMFPERVLNLIIEKYKDLVGGINPLEKNLSLENIQGISLQHKERLQEIAIDNAQNLASYSLIQLMKKTPFETRELLDWIGQAKLLVYAEDQIDLWRKIGIRSIFDLFKGDKTKESLMEVAQNMPPDANNRKLDPVSVGMIYEQVINDHGNNSLYNFECNMNISKSQASEAEKEALQEEA